MKLTCFKYDKVTGIANAIMMHFIIADKYFKCINMGQKLNLVTY